MVNMSEKQLWQILVKYSFYRQNGMMEPKQNKVQQNYTY